MSDTRSAADTRPRIGEGRIGAFLCAAIGLLSVAAVLCLRFPAFLTTPELRPHYDVELLRLVLATAMTIGAGLGVLSIALGGPRWRAGIGLSALFLAMLLGGPYVPTADFRQPSVYPANPMRSADCGRSGCASTPGPEIVRSISLYRYVGPCEARFSSCSAGLREAWMPVASRADFRVSDPCLPEDGLASYVLTI